MCLNLKQALPTIHASNPFFPTSFVICSVLLIARDSCQQIFLLLVGKSHDHLHYKIITKIKNVHVDLQASHTIKQRGVYLVRTASSSNRQTFGICIFLCLFCI